jgi:Superfamily I DNA and RNA helicases
MDMTGKIHFINAGAGSGKTTELVRIITDLLSSGKDDPSEFILTTYTRAAAGEFRDRTLRKLLSGNSAAQDAATRLDTAVIGTVHSVAMQYLERYLA